MTRLDEIAARLEAMPHNALNEDCAFLLAEVKRLREELGDACESSSAWQEDAHEFRALALSLAEALESSQRSIRELREQGAPHAYWDDVEAANKSALASPALLKLKGGE